MTLELYVHARILLAICMHQALDQSVCISPAYFRARGVMCYWDVELGLSQKFSHSFVFRTSALDLTFLLVFLVALILVSLMLL